MKNSLILSSLIGLSASLAYGMEPEVDNTKQYSFSLGTELLKILPPSITVGDFGNILVLGDKIDGWGNMEGSIASWLMVTANKNRIQNSAEQLLEELPFFLNTPYPTVHG